MKIHRLTSNPRGNVVTRSYFAGVNVVAEVPDNQGGVRKWALGGDDFVRIQFSLDEPIYLNVGDFILIQSPFDANASGHEEYGDAYALTEQYVPTFNETTGGYDYDVQFDAYWKLLANATAMLSYRPTGARLPSRFESRWKYTESLTGHADMLQNNIIALGFAIPQAINGDSAVMWLPFISVSTRMNAWSPAIYEADLADFVVRNADGGNQRNLAQEHRYVEYEGLSILDALKKLQEEDIYNCEMWYEASPYFIIHLGHLGHKMTQSDRNAERGVVITAQRGDAANADKHALQITPQNSEKEYFTRLRLFGSTNNIPDTYGKILTITKRDPGADDPAWPFSHDNTLIRTDVTMWNYAEEQDVAQFYDEIDMPLVGRYTSQVRKEFDVRFDFKTEQPYSGDLPVKLDMTSGIAFESHLGQGTFVTNVKLNLYRYSESVGDWVEIWGYEDTQLPSELDFSQILEDEFPNKADFTLVCEIHASHDSGSGGYVVFKPFLKFTREYNARANVSLYKISEDLERTGGVYNMTVFGRTDGGKFSKVVFIFDEEIPEGTLLTTDDYNAANTDWSPAYFEEILSRQGYESAIGERRLRMMYNGVVKDYVDAEGYTLFNHEIVEKVAVDDNFYPAVEMENGTVGLEASRTSAATLYEYHHSAPRGQWPDEGNQQDSWPLVKEYQDGSKKREYYEYFILSDTNETGILDADDGITEDWLITGETLRVHFNTGMLAGMEFEGLIERAAGKPRVIAVMPNENYGQVLPNGTLYPCTGDEYVLLGWNPTFISSTDAISKAGELLYLEAQERVNDAVRDHKTYQVRMDALSVSELQHLRWNDSTPVPIDDSDGIHMYTRDKHYEPSGILLPGTRVRLSDVGLFIRDRALETDGLIVRIHNCSELLRIVGFEYKLDFPFDGLVYTIGETSVLKGTINTLKKKIR